MSAHCRSRLASRTEHGAPYWPTCDKPAGHDGAHMSGHYADVSWHWTDEQAMTAEQVAPWERGER